MTENKVLLCDRIKRLGFAHEMQVRLYGETFQLVSDPIVIGDTLVFVDGIEKKSGKVRRIRVPLPIVLVAKRAA